MLVGSQPRRVAVVGGARIPFARAQGAYASVGNQEMLTAALKGVVDKFQLRGALLGDVVAGAVMKHSRQWNLTREALLDSGLAPILCVGESLAERQSECTDAVVTGQVAAGLAELSVKELDAVTIAYEPVWAIGTGHAATTEQAVAVHRAIRARIAAGWSGDAAEHMRILYGGSVTPQNAASLLSESDIDGALVGGACLKTESFCKKLHPPKKTTQQLNK